MNGQPRQGPHTRQTSIEAGNPNKSLDMFTQVQIRQSPDGRTGAAGSRASQVRSNLIAPGVMAENSPARLKAETNTANGGIGVSYSNVVLAGGLNPNGSPQASSNYKADFADSASKPQYPPNYQKGLDFNASQKYDYNILNGQSLSQKSLHGRLSSVQQPVLQNAASQMFIA